MKRRAPNADPQLSQYLEKVQDHYLGRVALEFPEDDRRAA